MKRALPVRAQRHRVGGVRLVPRDIELLSFIARTQPTRTSLLALYADASLDVVRRRVRVMRDLGFVAVHVPRMDGENELTLRAPARPLVAERLGCGEENVKVLRGVSGRHLDHHADGVRLLACIEPACAASEIRLDRFCFEDELRARAGAGRGVQVPDAAAVVVIEGARHAVAFEVDRGTESTAFVVDKKAKPYAELLRARSPLLGCSSWVVGITVASEKRHNQLAAAFIDADVDVDLFFFAVAGELTRRTILNAAGWRTICINEGRDTAKLVGASPFMAVISNHHVGHDGRAQGTP